MKQEGIDFGQALRLLAERAGVTLVSKQKERAEEKQWERLYQANEAAALFYHHLLLNTKGAQIARSHLEQRGISPETVEGFQLGFSPDSWDALRRHLINSGYGEDELLAAGLIVEKEGGGRRDLFRNRLMFPIRNVEGKVVGFGGRALDDTKPKYLNSPQTAIFDKSGILYGIDRAKGAIREQGLAIIVEGYTDVLTAHQQGMTNVVASMGTSLTEKQVRLVKGLTRNLTLALDADAAGEEATLRGLEIARQAFTERQTSLPDWLGAGSKLRASLKIILLPGGKDPDDVIRESPETWRRLVEEASSVMDYLFKAVTSKLDLNKEEDKAIAAEQLLPLISEIEDGMERELYLKRLAGLVGVEEKILAGKAARLRPTEREKTKRAGRKVVSLPSAKLLHHPLEEYCLCLLLQHPELRERGEQLLPEYFESTENREFFLAWRDSPGMEMMRHSLDFNLHEHLDSLMTRALPPLSERELEIAFADCLQRLEEQRLRRLKAIEEVLISEAESEGDEEEVRALLEKALAPSAQLRQLFLARKRERKGA
jgi:DNA primase